MSLIVAEDSDNVSQSIHYNISADDDSFVRDRDEEYDFKTEHHYCD